MLAKAADQDNSASEDGYEAYDLETACELIEITPQQHNVQALKLN